MRNLVAPCKGIQHRWHASRFECTSCSTASHSSAMRNARPCLADGRFTLRSTYSSTCPQHHQQQPILANNGPLRLHLFLRAVAAIETILLHRLPSLPTLQPNPLSAPQSNLLSAAPGASALATVVEVVMPSSLS